MIVSQASIVLYWNKKCCFATQSVHQSKPFFAKSKDHRIFAVFALCCLAYFTAVKGHLIPFETGFYKLGQIMHEHQCQEIVKLVRVLSFSLRCQLSPCHSIYLAIISIFALILAYFDRSCHKSANCGCICSIWRWVCLSESTCVQSDSTLRRSSMANDRALLHFN